MAAQFYANVVTVEETPDAFAVGFADDEFNPKRYLLVQRALLRSEQDTSLDIDAYHVELNDQRFSCYEGAESLELFPDRAIVTFAAEKTRQLGGERVLEVGFTLRHKQLDQLRFGLSTVFRGYECLYDRSA